MKYRHVDHDAELSEEEFRLLRDFVHERFGLYYDESQRASLRARLAPRLDLLGLSSFEDDHRYLRFAPERADEQQRMVSHLTNNETYFFREQPQLDVFAGHVLRALKERKTRSGEKRLHVLSAGCSTGEEPYSLAMLTHDMPSLRHVPMEIFGNDISRKVLKTARSGSYRESSFRQTEPHWIDKHFTRDGRMFKLNDDIRNRVNFGHLNLMDEAAMAIMNNVDVIFCRNVIIYFANDARAALLDMFHKKLRPGGFLLLGHSESLINASTKFELVPLTHDIVYRRPP